jgi:fimbrial chaperone protein
MVILMMIFLKKFASYHSLFLKTLAIISIMVPAEASYSQANFLIWPIYPVIENNQKAVPVWLENVGDSPAVVQVRVFKWTQNQYKEQFSTQQEIIGSPPIVKIPAGTKQMIRLTQAVPTPDLKENAYRVIVDELPVTIDNELDNSRVNFKMRYSIPLFTYGKGIGSGAGLETKKLNSKNPLAKPILTWSFTQVQGKEVLEIKNIGAMSARISEFKIGDKLFKAQAENNAYGYVLPNSIIHFSLSTELKNNINKTNTLNAIVGSKKEIITVEKQ